MQIGWAPGEKVLIFGIGNVGRQDDGLGIKLVERLEAAGLGEAFAFETNYQLNIEDALLMAEFDVVLFADASKEIPAPEPFSIRRLKAVPQLTFSTHAMEAGSVLSLCEELYGRKPRTFMLALPGYQWEIAEELSEKAQHNLDQAFASLLSEAQCMKSH